MAKFRHYADHLVVQYDYHGNIYFHFVVLLIPLLNSGSAFV
jgi:hypothetical protein